VNNLYTRKPNKGELKMKNLKLNFAERRGICPTYIKTFVHKNGIIALQYRPEVRGLWVEDHDDNEWIIINTNNSFGEVHDFIKAKSGREAIAVCKI
jgi:hypothetical protein